MNIDELRCIGNIEIIYPNSNKKFVMKTYIADKVNGNPMELKDNYSYWLPIDELISIEKRFTCDQNHNIINMKIKEC